MNSSVEQTEKVINHVLDIIYLMTGEEYMIVKRPPLYKCFPQVSEDLCQTRNSILEIPAGSPIHVRRSGCCSASEITYSMPGEAQESFLDSAFQPPPGGAHVQIKCDDVAMYLSVEEWKYLEHHKKEYEVVMGKNEPSPADGPNGQCLQAGYLSAQRAYNRNDPIAETNAVDCNSKNRFTAPKVSLINAYENNSSPKRESTDTIYGPKNMAEETWASTLQNNLTLNHGPLSGIFLETEIKEEQNNSECVMDDCEDTAIRTNNSDQVDSPSLENIQNFFSDTLKNTCRPKAWIEQECLINGHQIKTVNVTDSSVKNSYTLDFVPEPFSEKPQSLLILNGHQTKMAEFIHSDLLDSHTSDRVQSPFGDVHHHINKGLTNKRCSIVDLKTKTLEVSDSSLEPDHILGIANIFNDLPQTHKRTKLKNQEYSTDDHQTSTTAIKICPLENNTESTTNIFQNEFEKADIKRKGTYRVCSLDETKKEEINSLLEDRGDFYQLPNSFSDGPPRTCIKTELIHQEHSINGHQKRTTDKKGSYLEDRPILGFDTSPLKSHGKRKLTYQECLMASKQTKIVDVSHSNPENKNGLSIAWQTNKSSTPLAYDDLIKEPVHHTKNSTWQSTQRVQPNGKPLKKISCSDCGKLFSCNSYLSRHQRLHTGEKPYACSECGKSFSWMSSFVTHKRTHLGEKPFSCKQCGKRFSDYSGIIKHRRSHTGEKPYSCLVCGEHFAQTYQLVKHQAVHLVKDVAEKPLKGQ